MIALNKKIQIRDGFAGSKQIDVPVRVIENNISNHPLISNLYIKNIGFYPNARFHHRYWKNGCPENILIYCVNGKGWFKTKKQTHTVAKNECILITTGKEGISYGADENDPWTIYWVHFTGTAIADFNQTYQDRTNQPVNIVFDNLRINMWKEMYNWLSAGYSLENLCKSNFCLPHFISTFLYSQFMEDKDSDNQLIRDIIKFMQTDIDKRITSDTIAKAFNISASHIRMLFRKISGIPVNEYLISLRIQKSSHLLMSTDMRIVEICDQTGFTDPYYFSRCFKKETGLSPLHYRKQYR